MYRVKLTAKAKKGLKQLSYQDKLSIGEIIEELKEEPSIGKPLDRELIRKFSYRTGVYRILYLVNEQDKTITILTAAHRSVVYN